MLVLVHVSVHIVICTDPNSVRLIITSNITASDCTAVTSRYLLPLSVCLGTSYETMWCLMYSNVTVPPWSHITKSIVQLVLKTCWNIYHFSPVSLAYVFVWYVRNRCLLVALYCCIKYNVIIDCNRHMSMSLQLKCSSVSVPMVEPVFFFVIWWSGFQYESTWMKALF